MSLCLQEGRLCRVAAKVFRSGDALYISNKIKQLCALLVEVSPLIFPH